MSANPPPDTNPHGARNRVRWLLGVCALAAACVIVSTWLRHRAPGETDAGKQSLKTLSESNSSPAGPSEIVAERIQTPLLLVDTNSPEAQLVSQLLNRSLPL